MTLLDILIQDQPITLHSMPYISTSKISYNGDQRIKMANGNFTSTHRIGNFAFGTPTLSKPLYLHNLLHVPSISKNLLSVSKLAKDNNVF